MDNDYELLQNYLHFVNELNKLNTHEPYNILFINIHNICYMYYNETSIINGNDLNIQFSYSGISNIKSKLYYYIGFNKNEYDNILNKINKKKYNIIVIDEYMNIILKDDNSDLQIIKTNKTIKSSYNTIKQKHKTPFIFNNEIIPTNNIANNTILNNIIDDYCLQQHINKTILKISSTPDMVIVETEYYDK